MHKKAVKAFKITLSLLVLLILIVGIAKAIEPILSLDKDLRNRIDTYFVDGEPSHLIYQGITYTYSGYGDPIYSNYTPATAIMLSWNGNPWIGTANLYYSDTTENPLWISEERNGMLFVREDYDYLSDTFIVEGTNIEFILKDILCDRVSSFDYDEVTSLEAKSKQGSLFMTMTVTRVDNQWCVILGFLYTFGNQYWTLSDSFAETLMQNDIISASK